MRHKYFRFLACVAMVLACVMMFEVPVSADPIIQLSDYTTTVTDYGSYKVYNYLYDSGHYSKVQYENNGVHYDQVNTKTMLLDLSNALPNSTVAYIGFVDHTVNYTSGSNGFLVSDIVSDNNFKQFSVSIPISIRSTVAISFKIYGGLATLNSSGRSYNRKFESAAETVNLTAGATFNKTIQVSLSDFSDGDVAVAPYVVIDFYEHPSSGNITIDSYNFSAQAKIGTGLPDFPSFKKNIGGTLTYVQGMESEPLTVSASVSDGGSISYRWYEVSSSGDTYVRNGTSYYPSTTTLGTKSYYCVATNTIDGKESSTTSGIVTINVISAPKEPQITQNLGIGTVEYVQNNTASPLAIQAISIDGGTLSYQWYVNDVESTEGGSVITGATSSIFVPPTTDIGTRYYYCVLSNTVSGYSAVTSSRVATVRVVSPPDPAKTPTILSNLPTEPVTYTEGDAAAPLRIDATSPDGGALTYQWYEVIDGSGKALPGEIYPTFTPATSVPGEYMYYCVVTNTLEDTSASATSTRATVVVEEDRTDSLLDTIVGGVSDIIDGILNLPQLIIDGIKSLFIPDAWEMAAYQLKWEELFAARFGAIYEAVVLIDEFGQAIGEQARQGTVTFPAITLDLAGTPWTFGGWEVKVVPDGFDVVIGTLKTAINIVCTFAFVNGLRHRFEGVIGGA